MLLNGQSIQMNILLLLQQTGHHIKRSRKGKANLDQCDTHQCKMK